MNDNAKQWVEALRSGRFEQAQGYLRTPEGYCCLGVACELYAAGNPDATWLERDLDYDQPDQPEQPEFFGFAVGEYMYEGELPRPVKEWLGLTNVLGLYDEANEIGGLARLNDRGASFEEIAATIEAEPEGLFA